MGFLQKSTTFLLLTLGVFAGTASAADIVQSIQNDLEFDENGKLTAHHVVYPAGSEHCVADHFREPSGFQLRALSGEALRKVFPGAAEGDCVAACLEKGTDRSVAHAAMPHRHWDGSGVVKTWFEEACRRVEVCLINYHSKDTPIKIFWLAESGEKKFHVEVPYGERNTRCFTSFIGHEFIAEDGATGEFLEKLVVEHITTKALGESPHQTDPNRQVDKLIESTLNSEWKRHQRVTRTFSELGFKKGRLPDDIFASMGAFYYNNRHNKVREEWGGKGVFVNWWETDCSFLPIPWEMKSKWQSRLRELVEVWAGVPIEQTDMYGMRRYEHGARLLTHVDRESTHAVSLIVNIAQGNLTEPWPVEVNDHANRLHEVIMEPGDIVYYESAKALHGRNRPLMGDDAYYVNLFTHYRPTGDPEWFHKPNPENVPEPVIDVEGSCRLEPISTVETPNRQLAVVEAVKCDDPRLGPYVSPSLFQASSAKDLMDWWRSTSPPKADTQSTSSGRDEL